MSPQRHTLGAQRNEPGSNPDDSNVNWSQVSETLAMLALAVAQIDTSLHEGSQSIDQLMASFTAMAANTQQLLQITSDSDHSIPAEIGQIGHSLQTEMQQAMIAFQFYDRLTQRLNHVGESLEKTGHLIADPEQRYQPVQWSGLQQQIKNNYTMESERIMFEHIMAGHSVAEALEIYHHNLSQNDLTPYGNDHSATDDSIELF